MTRFKIAEKQFHETELEVIELKKKIEELNNEIKELKYYNNQLEKEIDKRSKLSLVAIAAKSSSDNDLKLIEKMLGKNKIASKRLQKENDDYKAEIKDMEEYIKQLQKMIEDANKIHLELENQIILKNTEIIGNNLKVEKIIEELNLFKVLGMTDEKQKEWEEREDAYKKMQEKSNKLTIQCRKYQAKIEELTEQVMTLENELGT